MLDRRGMPSRSASWRAFAHGFELAAICWSVRSGAAALMPATSRIRRSSLCCGLARSSKLASMISSSASRRTVRRSRSTVQVVACPRFRTRTTSPHGLVGAHLPHGGQPGVQWRQDAFQIDDDDGRHCLVGGLEHIRACRGGGDRAGEYLSRAIRDVCGKRQTIIKFNDSRESYAEIRAVILHARKLALQVIVDYAG
jgi:hypothetical protein